jgi:hypothetical protein
MPLIWTAEGTVATPAADFDYTNLLWRVRAADLALSNNDPVSTWFDLYSGSSRNWAASGSERPLFKTNIINGHAALYFQPSRMFGPDLSGLGLTEADIYILPKLDNDPPSSAPNSGLWRFNDGVSASAATHYRFPGDSNIYQSAFINDGNRLTANPASSLASPRLYRVVAKTGTNNYEMFLDNVSLNTMTQGTIVFPSSTELGRSASNGGSVQAFIVGHIAEFFAFSAKCGSTQNGTIVSYVNSYYGLSI